MFIFPFNRRKLFVDKKFQSKFLLTFISFMLIIIILLSFLILYNTSKEISGSVYNKIVSLKNTRQILFPVIFKITIIILVIGGGFCLYNLLIYSNKIIGPINRYKKQLKELGDGNLTVFIKFRKDDELNDIADLLTESSNKLNNRLKAIKNNFNNLSMLLNQKEFKGTNKEKFKKINKNISDIETLLNKFKTK